MFIELLDSTVFNSILLTLWGFIFIFFSIRFLLGKALKRNEIILIIVANLLSAFFAYNIWS